jgi:CRP-like cAMP-binding protein
VSWRCWCRTHRGSRGVRALTHSRILALSRETFDLLLEREPSFARELLRTMAARLVEARTGR